MLNFTKNNKSGKNEVLNTVDIFRLNHPEDDKFV